MSTSTAPALRGSCFCGLITFSSRALPFSLDHCHCRTCRTLHGAPYATFAAFPNTDLTWTVASPLPRDPAPQYPTPKLPASTTLTVTRGMRLLSSDIAVRGSCAACGTPLFMKYHCAAERTDVPVAAIEAESVVGELPRASMHIFAAQKMPWYEIADDGLERWERWNPRFEGVLKKWEQGGKRKREEVWGVGIERSGRLEKL